MPRTEIRKSSQAPRSQTPMGNHHVLIRLPPKCFSLFLLLLSSCQLQLPLTYTFADQLLCLPPAFPPQASPGFFWHARGTTSLPCSNSRGFSLDQLLGQAPLNFRPHFLCSCSLQTQAHAVHTSVCRLFPLPETSLPTSNFLLFQISSGDVSRKLSFEEYFHSVLPDHSRCSYIIMKVSVNVSASPQNCTLRAGTHSLLPPVPRG